jgi:tRNA threonylcarbamoyladenosine biosynthesis protein TsaE
MKSGSAGETKRLGARLARGLAAAAAARREGILLGLTGDLGAGKTTFVQGFVEALPGGRGLYVTSPTFSIVQQYGTDPPVRHLDLYRISTLTELETIGYRELCFSPGFTLIEWIDRVPDALPAEWMEIRLAVDPSDVREIGVHSHGEALAELVGKIR